MDSELEHEAIRLTSKPPTTKPGTGTCEKEMGLCIAQCKMPLFCAKTIVIIILLIESCKFGLYRSIVGHENTWVHSYRCLIIIIRLLF